jgi:RNA polymerase sigma-70 factor, ECF subfamily
MTSLLVMSREHSHNEARGRTEQRRQQAENGLDGTVYHFVLSMDPESSFELIRRAQDGDSDALGRLLARYRPRLVRWATGRLPSHARDITDTEDIVQEALIGTFRNLQAFDTRGEWALQAYLRRAVVNRVRDELRRVKSQPRREELVADVAADDSPSPLQAAMGKEGLERYEAALATIDEVEREAVIARLELGCSYHEIALLVDKPTADAARMLVARALAKLAAVMARA